MIVQAMTPVRSVTNSQSGYLSECISDLSETRFLESLDTGLNIVFHKCFQCFLRLEHLS